MHNSTPGAYRRQGEPALYAAACQRSVREFFPASHRLVLDERAGDRQVKGFRLVNGDGGPVGGVMLLVAVGEVDIGQAGFEVVVHL
jgi:hypothetical protein